MNIWAADLICALLAGNVVLWIWPGASSIGAVLGASISFILLQLQRRSEGRGNENSRSFFS